MCAHSKIWKYINLEKKKNIVSQINTGKVRYVHGIYPSSFNKTKGEITLDEM